MLGELPAGSMPHGTTAASKTKPLRGALRLLACCCACACSVLIWAAGNAGAYTASLTRTAGGIANIEADNMGNAGFGTGYAQAQDGICTLADVYLTLSGERSRFYGPTATVKDEDEGVTETDLNSDLYWTSIKDNHTIENLLAEPFPQGPSATAKEVVAGFAAGYDKYLEEAGGSSGITNPACHGAAWVRPITALDVWRRMFQLDTLAGGSARAGLIALAEPPAGQPMARKSQAAKRDAYIAARPKLTQDMGNALAEEATVSGSNGLGIGSEDATNGDGLILSNPHFPWIGDERFWESHVNVPGTYDMIGASLWGVPLVTIGHNQHVGWTHTVSTNITTTEWRLKLVPGHDTQYLVNEEAVPMTHQEVTVQALEGGVLVPHTHTFYYSRYGPIVASPAWSTTTATAFDDANGNNLRGADQWLAMGKASSAEGVINAETEIEGVPWVNTIGSDDKGNAFYTEIVVTPNLPSSYLAGPCNFSATHSDAGPFDGSKTECELPTDTDSVVPHIFGAEHEPVLMRHDYVENSNNSFWLANAKQPLTGFSPALGGENTNPGLRAQTGIDMVNQRVGALSEGVPTDGLSATPGFTVETLQNSWTAFRSMPAERALPGLREICENALNNSGVINKVNVSAACPILNSYDESAKLNSPGGWLFNRWWASAPTTNASFWVNPWSLSNPVYTPNTLNVKLEASQNALASAVSELEKRGIPLNASFGQVQYTQRASKIPVPGCYEGDNCFAIINSTYDSSTAATAHVTGSSSSIVMFTELNPTTGPITKGLLTYSQSEDLTSPFYEDQTLDFSKNEWITLPWTAAQVSEDELAPPKALSTEPGAPHLAAGDSSPNQGVFTLEWTASGAGATYTLQHENHSGVWETVTSGLTHAQYSFGSGSSEAEGTWTYRVQASEEGANSEFSGASAEVKVDRTPPSAPSAQASRAPDYSAGGGWYKNSVEVSFTANGDPPLPDGSAGSGVNAATLSGPQVFEASGSHEACGTVADNAGNVSEPGCVTVQVDATPPSLEVSCPAMVAIGSSADATFTASDSYSGLASPASGSLPINTSKAGDQTVSTTAVSNVGLETTRSCTTYVGYYVVITGPVARLTVYANEAVLLGPKARVAGPVKVKPGGALDVEGATLSKSLTASDAALLRMCGASVGGKVNVKRSSGPVVLGEGTEECESNTFSAAVALTGNTAGVLVEANVFDSALTVTGNSGGTTVTNNKVTGTLKVTGNSGTVLDRPNEAKGKSKLQ